jgi:hypothetical protein
MFTNRTAAIVIEFYPFQNISNNTNWRITGLLGYTAIHLNSRSHDALVSTSAADGMRTEGIIFLLFYNLFKLKLKVWWLKVKVI